MTLTKEERSKWIIFSTHFFQGTKESKHLFPDGWLLKNCKIECVEALRDPQKSIILPELRSGKDSTHTCLFVGTSKHIVCVPLVVVESSIVLVTIEDPREDRNNPNWFVKPYNEIAKQRGMEIVAHEFRYS